MSIIIETKPFVKQIQKAAMDCWKKQGKNGDLDPISTFAIPLGQLLETAMEFKIETEDGWKEKISDTLQILTRIQKQLDQSIPPIQNQTNEKISLNQLEIVLNNLFKKYNIVPIGPLSTHAQIKFIEELIYWATKLSIGTTSIKRYTLEEAIAVLKETEQHTYMVAKMTQGKVEPISYMKYSELVAILDFAAKKLQIEQCNPELIEQGFGLKVPFYEDFLLIRTTFSDPSNRIDYESKYRILINCIEKEYESGKGALSSLLAIQKKAQELEE